MLHFGYQFFVYHTWYTAKTFSLFWGYEKKKLQFHKTKVIYT